MVSLSNHELAGVQQAQGQRALEQLKDLGNRLGSLERWLEPLDFRTRGNDGSTLQGFHGSKRTGDALTLTLSQRERGFVSYLLWNRATPVLVDFGHHSKGVLHVCQGLRQCIALCYQLRKQRRGDGVSPFRLRLQDQRYSRYHLAILNRLCRDSKRPLTCYQQRRFNCQAMRYAASLSRRRGSTSSETRRHSSTWGKPESMNSWNPSFA